MGNPVYDNKDDVTMVIPAVSLLRSIAGTATCTWTHKPGFLWILSQTIRGMNYVPDANIYSYNRILNNLMKSGSFESALKVFDEMTERDVITWNIMISGYRGHGSVCSSLNLYREMVSQGIVENSSTFSTVLSMCSSAGFFKEGLLAHCRAIVLGFRKNIYIASALVDLYLQMGLVDTALRLFSTLPERNSATWNVVLRAFCEMGSSKELIRLYIDMKLDGVEPNGVTFCYLIQGCGSERLLDVGTQLHCCVIKKGLSESNIFVANALVDFYSACGSYVETRKSFEGIPPEDVISWNSMVTVCASNGYMLDAIDTFQRMHFWDKKPSVLAFSGFLKLATVTDDVWFGKQIHCCILKLGFAGFLIHSALIDMYGKCGDIENAVAVFDAISNQAIECCNPLMSSLLRSGLVKDVIELFGLMVDESIGYDEVSLSLTLKALSVSVPASSGTSALLHGCAVKSGFEFDIAVSCALIDAYSRSGEIEFSLRIFNQLTSPNVICFTSIITAFARNGMGKECLKMLDLMIKSGLKPDKVTFLGVLTGCNHSGLVEEGRLIFHSMGRNGGLSPERQHYSCMVDLLGRAGLVDEAEQLVSESPWKEDYAIWSSVLRSCRSYRNERVGKRAAKMLVELEPENPSGWLQASNFYSDIGDFETMRECQEIAVARRTVKEIGQSLIEVHS